jgi:hypothetical protein
MQNDVRVLLDANELGAAVGLHPETVRRMHREGRIPGLRVGRTVKYELGAVLETFRRVDQERVTATMSLAAPDFEAIAPDKTPTRAQRSPAPKKSNASSRARGRRAKRGAH